MRSAGPTMMRSFTFVTTCSQAGWVEYAETMVDSFDKNFPPEMKLVVYVDFKAPPSRHRVEFRQISQTGMSLENYHFALSEFDFALGQTVPYSEHDFANTYGIIWNARKFSFKVFTICHAIMTGNSDVVVWLDADSNIVDRVDYNVINRSIPEYAMVSYLGRSWRYTECGYVAYNMSHPLTNLFAEAVVQMYTSGAVFSLKEWHDSYVFDVVRLYFERRLGVRNFNIAKHVDDLDHVFLNTELGLYIDHMKGPRKTEGKSRLSDRVVTYEPTDERPTTPLLPDCVTASQDHEQSVTIISEQRDLTITLVGNHLVLTQINSSEPLDLLVKVDDKFVGLCKISETRDVSNSSQKIPLPSSIYDGVEHEITILHRNTRRVLATYKFLKSDTLLSIGQREKIPRDPFIYAETEFRAIEDLFNSSTICLNSSLKSMGRPDALEHLNYLTFTGSAHPIVGVALFCSTISEVWNSPALKQLAFMNDLNFELIVVMQSREACRFARALLRGSQLQHNIQIVSVDQFRDFLRDQAHLETIVTLPTATAMSSGMLERLRAVACGDASGFASPVATAQYVEEAAIDIVHDRTVREWMIAQDLVSVHSRADFLQRSQIRTEHAEGVPRRLIEVKVSSDSPALAVRVVRSVHAETLGLPPSYDVAAYMSAESENSRKDVELLLSIALQKFANATIIGPIGEKSAIRQLCIEYGANVVQARSFKRRVSLFEIMDVCLPSQPVLMVELGKEISDHAPLETLLSQCWLPPRSTGVAWRRRVPINAILDGETDAVTESLKTPESGVLFVFRSA